jgi:hypothetical protein
MEVSPARLGPPLLLALALVACEKKDGAGDDPIASLTAAWTKQNLTVSAFTEDKSGAIGTSCRSGTVGGVDVVVCKFGNDAEAKAAEAKGLEWVGAATGTALSKGSMLLAVVDRRNADPSGRTINAIAKAMR